MTSGTLGSLLDYLLIVGLALTAIKLLATGLYKHYPIFLIYFLFRVPTSIIPNLIDHRSKLYFRIWTYSEAITLVFYILLVVELYRVVLGRYRGLRTVGQWAMYASVAIAAAVSMLVNALPGLNGLPPTHNKINTWLVA